MNTILQWVADRPYIVAGSVFLGLAVAGVRLFGWSRSELEFLLLLYVIVLVGIRLDEISRKIGSGGKSANPGGAETVTLLAKLDQIAQSLQELNDTFAKLTASRRRGKTPSAEKQNPPPDKTP